MELEIQLAPPSWQSPSTKSFLSYFLEEVYGQPYLDGRDFGAYLRDRTKTLKLQKV
jgi:hypothetical protein